ncbi:hypothetical protein BLNAU_9608 [Blattamonas nauphoetae]|uniref:Uncharacterized protein n=1 Tax=Blattamonas nauphoetae TaxID=2049346 RepID=A0ABQ9XV69_9EUKA|nr:hypothetical protein BLNAU_9608 [Blattamonas nauphoetae]
MPSRRRVSKMSEELSKRDGPKSGDIGQIDEENISEDGESANHTRFSDKQDILSEELIQDQLRMSDLEFGRLSGGLVHSRSENDAEWERTDTHPPHHPPTTLSPTSALLCRKPSTLRISILTPPRLVHSHTHFTLLLLPNTKNLVSRLISREIDIGVTAFITETTRMRKEGRRKEKRCPSVFLAFWIAARSHSNVDAHTQSTIPTLKTDTPAKPVQQKLVCFTIFGSTDTRSSYAFHSPLDPTVGRTIASFSDSRWKDVLSYRTFPSCGKLNVALSRPLLSCSAGTLVISPSSFTATDQSQLTVPLVCSSPLSSSASNSATDQMRIEMEEVEFSNLNVDGSVDGVVQIEGADSLRLKKVDFSNVKNGASDAVRIFVMGAEKDGMWCGEADFPCRSLNEADKHLKHALPSTMEVQTSAVLHSELDLTHDITKITSGSGEKGRSLQKAFRDGTYFEKMTLLKMWMRWFDFREGDEHGEMMTESDFDFDGFLAADLSDSDLFDQSCSFVLSIIMSDVTLMTLRWKLDFLLSFEKRHQMMSRLSSDPNPSLKQKPSILFLSPLATKLSSFLSVFRGCDFPSVLTELITIDLDSIPHQLPYIVSPSFFLNHTSIDPNHRHSFFPMDLMFERFLRDDPNEFFREWLDVSECTPRKVLSTPYVGLHSLLLRSPELNLNPLTLYNLLHMLSLDISDQDTTEEAYLTLFAYNPPHRLLDTLVSFPHLIRDKSIIWISLLIIVQKIGDLTAPFGTCASLAQVFKMLSLFDQNSEQVESDLLSEVGEIVVSLHWLNIPAHFDSPLLCHLPSLAGAQRGVLQTLSSHSGIPSLLTPTNSESNLASLQAMMFEELAVQDAIPFLSWCVRYLASSDCNYFTIGSSVSGFLAWTLKSPIPAVASATIEFFHRFVSVSSDAVRIELVKKGLLDHVVFAVSNSSFLDDYEKGIAVIGILLAAIRRSDQKRRMRVFDFDRCLNADS